ncbi:hypothetical protein HZA43_00635 [Candidatus Peregrinibacteria bacterium]|nr:hypothetical protein [Candidatus Peregrinibacteria bacterium]
MSLIIIQDDEVIEESKDQAERPAPDRRHDIPDIIGPDLQIVPITPTPQKRHPVPGVDFPVIPTREKIRKPLLN